MPIFYPIFAAHCQRNVILTFPKSCIEMADNLRTSGCLFLKRASIHYLNLLKDGQVLLKLVNDETHIVS